MYKCLIVDELHENIHPLLKNIGVEVSYCPQYQRNEIIEHLRGMDGLIIRSKTTVDEELLQYADKLKFVARAGAGIDNLDQYYLESKNINILNAPEGNRDAVAEHVIGLILNLSNNISRSNQEVKKGRWNRESNRGFELNSKTIGLIGYGNMGKALASKLSVFDCNIIAYDKYKTGFADTHCKEVSLQQLFQETDILSLHTPLTNETNGMVNKNFFECFRKNIIFINTARGEISPLSDLVQCLQSGKISAAGLDVLESEKLNKLTKAQKECFDILSSNNNVILTPHVAGWSAESYKKINEVLVNKIKKVLLSN